MRPAGTIFFTATTKTVTKYFGRHLRETDIYGAVSKLERTGIIDEAGEGFYNFVILDNFSSKNQVRPVGEEQKKGHLPFRKCPQSSFLWTWASAIAAELSTVHLSTTAGPVGRRCRFAAFAAELSTVHLSTAASPASCSCSRLCIIYRLLWLCLRLLRCAHLLLLLHLLLHLHLCHICIGSGSHHATANIACHTHSHESSHCSICIASGSFKSAGHCSLYITFTYSRI